ncbi:SAM-dependent methyltransferase [Verrucomicrobiota bacterium]
MSKTNDKRDDRERFFNLLRECANAGTLVRLTLSKNKGDDPTLKNVIIRPVELKGKPQLSFVYRHQTRDITKNHPIREAIELIDTLLGPVFKNAHLNTATEEAQLLFSKKGKPSFGTRKAANAPAPQSTGHDRQKKRLIDPARPFLRELGVTNANHEVLPSMSRKWKQINSFLQLIDHAIKESKLADAKQLHIADFGSGKGYLTFAVHDHLSHTLGIDSLVTGIELRDSLVELCNKAADKLSLETLKFHQGDVRTYTPEQLNIMIALHACDIATDIAIHTGIRTGADIIMCAPCCHKEIRPQIQVPDVLKPMLDIGIHLGQEADMITDTLRALQLEAHGYSTQVFEFISLEHTSKNKMILAVKRAKPSEEKQKKARDQFADLKSFYGIKTQYLETLLSGAH